MSQIGEPRVASVIEQDIVRLEIAMHDAACRTIGKRVQEEQTLCDLFRKAPIQCVECVERRRSNELFKTATGCQLHHNAPRMFVDDGADKHDLNTEFLNDDASKLTGAHRPVRKK